MRPRLSASRSPTSITSRSRRTSQRVATATTTDGSASTNIVPAGGPEPPEDPRVDLAERLGILLLEERLHGGEERRDGDARRGQAGRRTCRPRLDRPSPYARPTPAMRTDECRDRHGELRTRPTGPYTTAIVAPSPAPAAAPSRYGSASGFRNTAWYAAPEAESDAPTSAATITLGSRRFPRIAACCSDMPGWRIAERDQPPKDVRGADLHGSDQQAGEDGHDEHDHPERGRAELRRVTPPVAPHVRDGRSDRAQVVHDPRSPARGDVFVQRDHAAVLTAAIRAHPGRFGDAPWRLPQHFVSARKIEVGVSLDDVLGRELRVPAAGSLRLVGDVAESGEGRADR